MVQQVCAAQGLIEVPIADLSTTCRLVPYDERSASCQKLRHSAGERRPKGKAMMGS